MYNLVRLGANKDREHAKISAVLSVLRDSREHGDRRRTIQRTSLFPLRPEGAGEKSKWAVGIRPLA